MTPRPAYTVVLGVAAIFFFQALAGAFLVLVAVPSVVAEGWFGLWLLTRARRSPSA